MYQVFISNSAEKDMDKLPMAVLKKVGKVIDNLAQDPRPAGCKKLKAATENLWRVLVGDYRVVYLIEDKVEVVDIRRVRHRKDGYS